jgi:hypothetical protein
MNKHPFKTTLQNPAKLPTFQVNGRKPVATRYPYHIDIFLTNGHFVGRTSNISETGFFIPTCKPESMDEDRIYPIVIQTQNKAWPVVYALAEIRWKKDQAIVGGFGYEIFPSNKETMMELMELIKQDLQGQEEMENEEMAQIESENAA